MNTNPLINISPKLRTLYPISKISVKNFNFVEESPSTWISSIFEKESGYIYPVKYERLGNTGIYPLFAEIAISFNIPPITTNIEPIIAEIYCL